MVTLPETNSLPMKMDGWNTTFLLGKPIFRGELLVSGRVVILVAGFRMIHQEFRSVPKMEGFLNLSYKAILGVGFPEYISRIHTAYIGEYLHFRYLQCSVNDSRIGGAYCSVFTK